MSNNVSNNKTNKESKKVLIVGLGISGISSAIALKKQDGILSSLRKPQNGVKVAISWRYLDLVDLLLKI
ncbi:MULTISPECIES: hypothetical protein [unclassified Staphylococcus]|uniref:hypothetical protein n=1 Tax=unclassified Staphylococcus TaxID=91994 RepID=UPI001AEC40E3|nr:MULTISPECIES: hypothetical protein [unclassified Staphylococcus]